MRAHSCLLLLLAVTSLAEGKKDPADKKRSHITVPVEVDGAAVTYTGDNTKDNPMRAERHITTFKAPEPAYWDITCTTFNFPENCRDASLQFNPKSLSGQKNQCGTTRVKGQKERGPTPDPLVISSDRTLADGGGKTRNIRLVARNKEDKGYDFECTVVATQSETPPSGGGKSCSNVMPDTDVMRSDGSDYIDNDDNPDTSVAWIGATTVDECIDACESHADCVAWNEADGQCYLMAGYDDNFHQGVSPGYNSGICN